MGLDMYFMVVEADRVADRSSDINFEIEDKFNRPELHYFRKHNQLNGWLQELYVEKGGDYNEFNCSVMIMTISDFRRLRRDVRLNNLKPASGFFWGNCVIDRDVKNEYYQLCRKAINRIRNHNEVVYYTPNW